MRVAVAGVVVFVVVACTTPYEAETGDGGLSGTCGADACPSNACGLVNVSASCGVVDCGACADGERCVDGSCKCTPRTCSEMGAQCGAAPDGCGGQVFCGECASAPVDAGSDGGDAGADGGGALACGAANKCVAGGCVPKKASEACFSPTVRLCGPHSDGCGGIVDCGTSACTGVGEKCGGGGKAGECGCKPLSSCNGACSSTCPNGCGGTRRCNCTNCH